jgi:hypothetical protein
MSGEITALLRKTPGGGIEARGYNDQWQTVPRDAVAEIQRLTEENEMLRASLGGAVQDIAKERYRQMLSEGWSFEHDDEHTDESLALVAALYASPLQLFAKSIRDSETHHTFRDPWPESWDDGWDRRGDFDKRRLLVIAGALIAAEIDRLDRAALKGGE